MSKQALLGAAFASADLIFEVDANGLITFALGATTGIVAKENGPLTGQSWRQGQGFGICRCDQAHRN